MRVQSSIFTGAFICVKKILHLNVVIYLFAYLFFIYLFIIYLFLFICLFIYLFIFICLFIYFIYIFIKLFIYLIIILLIMNDEKVSLLQNFQFSLHVVTILGYKS